MYAGGAGAAAGKGTIHYPNTVMKRITMLCAAAAACVGCAHRADYDLTRYGSTALYYGGDIVTVARPAEAEAVLVGDGRIVAVGDEARLRRSCLPSTVMIDLGGRTMLPGFIDSHSHISKVTKYPDFSPAAGVTSREKLVEYGRAEFDRWYDKAVADGEYEAGDWFVGNGYDNTAFPDYAGPTVDDLDRISATVPVCIIHMSNHVAVVNTPGLKAMGYTPGSPQTERYSSLLGRFPDGRLDGLLEEEAFFRLYYDPNVLMDNARTNAGRESDVLRRAMREYASRGITTAQDGGGSTIAASAAEIIAADGRLPIDINSYGERAAMPGPSRDQKYENGFRIAGVKLFLDGSPQAKTAWLLEPYYVIPEGKPAGYDGFPQMTDEALYDELAACMEGGYHVIAHVNGSAAIGQFLEQYAQVKRDMPAAAAPRPTLIHAQTATEEQFDDAATLGVDVSFFDDHVYYWGDYYVASILGPERSRNISPMQWALRRGLNVTIHQDSPVVPPDMILSMHVAVNRTTRDGLVLGPWQAVSPLEAVRMVTVNGARQYGQQDDRGTIEEGKTADFVILDRNPLKVPHEQIRDIRVMETIKEGRTIFRAGDE